jgi:hypothetical protein
MRFLVIGFSLIVLTGCSEESLRAVADGLNGYAAEQRAINRRNASSYSVQPSQNYQTTYDLTCRKAGKGPGYSSICDCSEYSNGGGFKMRITSGESYCPYSINYNPTTNTWR